jgi:hypothetical protein
METDSILFLDKTPPIEKKIGGVLVTAHWGVRYVFFVCGPKGRYGRARWSLSARDWVRTQYEVGTQFKLAIKEAFGLEN